MRRTSGMIIATGLTAVMAIGGCGGGEGNDHERKEPVTVRVATDYDIQTYQRPYNMEDGPGPKAGQLKVGSTVLAICLVTAPAPEFSTIRVQANDEISYAGVYGMEGSKDTTPTPLFGQDLNTLMQQLPLCPPAVPGES